MKHTPAPWDINAYNLCEVIVIRNGASPDGKTYIDGRYQERVAMVGTDNSATWTERRANARLVAAAPELLAALQDFINGVSTGAITSEHDETFANLLKNAHIALTKTTGA